MEGCGLGITVRILSTLGDSIDDLVGEPVGLGVGLRMVLVGEFIISVGVVGD